MSDTAHCRCKGCGKLRSVSRFPTRRRLCNICLPAKKREEWTQYKIREASAAS